MSLLGKYRKRDVNTYFLSRVFTVMIIVISLHACTMPHQPNSGTSSLSLLQDTPDKIAIVVLSERKYQVPERAIEDQFISGLLGKGYAVASRSDVQTVFQELKFQQSGMTEADAARLGKLLNVPAVLVVAVTQLDSHRNSQGMYNLDAAMGARLLSVEKAEILWINSAAYQPIFVTKDAPNKEATLIYLAKKLVDSFPSRTVTAPVH